MKNFRKVILSLVAVLIFTAFSFGQQIATQQPSSCTLQSPESRAIRHAVFLSDAKTKVAVWQEHLSKELATLSLTQEQRKLIVQAKRLVTESFYDGRTTSPDFKQTDFGKEFEQFFFNVKANFSNADASKIFEQVDIESYNKIAPSKLIQPYNNLSPLDCNCSATWTLGCSYPGCVTGLHGCTPIIDCGPFYGFQCDGGCNY